MRRVAESPIGSSMNAQVYLKGEVSAPSGAPPSEREGEPAAPVGLEPQHGERRIAFGKRWNQVAQSRRLRLQG